jgi:TonB family protein
MTRQKTILSIVAAVLVASGMLAQQPAPQKAEQPVPQPAQPTTQQIDQTLHEWLPEQLKASSQYKSFLPSEAGKLESSPGPQVILECDRAIYILNYGLTHHWATRELFINAFQAFDAKGTSGDSLDKTRLAIVSLLQNHLREHRIWDEGMPVEVEVNQIISDLTQIRDAKLEEERAKDADAAAAQQQPSVAMPVRVARAVMAGMALRRPNPVYPEEAKEKHVQGAVTLHAIISKTGTVESLDVISGPEELRDSALDAFRQWTYKPFLLNGQPVEVETTIIVVYNLPDWVSSQNGAEQTPVPEAIKQNMQKAQARAEQEYKDGRIVPMQIGGDVTTPVVIWQPSPEYTEEARKAKFEGTVTVSLIVNNAGIPLNVHVTKGVGMGLDEKAVEAVKQYRFKPAMQNGKPVAVFMNVEVNFEAF